jgi:hypothetical protein
MAEFFGLCELTHTSGSPLVVRGGGAIVGWTQVIMPTVKQLGISIAIAMAIVGAGAFGISAYRTQRRTGPHRSLHARKD